MRQLKEAAEQVFTQVEYAIQKHQMHYINYYQSWQACILHIKLTPIAVLLQNGPLL